MTGAIDLLDALYERVEDLADEITEQIRFAVPAYSQVPRAEHGRDVLVQISTIIDPEVRVGIGLPRRGISGATASLQDAMQSLDLALSARRDIRFATDWLLVLLHAAGDRLGQILTPGITAAAAQPALADTVRAYADAGYSVSACARRLHIHPDTASYRLDRWRDLTGLDVRDFASLATSLACLNALDRPDAQNGSGRLAVSHHSGS